MVRALYTTEGEGLPAVPWNSYPRPRLRRRDWLCLNGVWELTAEGRTVPVLVPFCPESLLSGVEAPPPPGAALRYRRRFSVPEGWQGKRVLLHFGAVSRHAEASVNGTCCAVHENGCLPFSAEITGLLRQGENELEVLAVNDLSHSYPWGKQSARRGGMWYTPCSGIWQTVWLECVPEEYIRELSVQCGPGWAELVVEGVSSGSVRFEGRDWPLEDGRVRLVPAQPELWSPEHPKLYPFTVACGGDRVESYFALRSLEVREIRGIPRLCLNGAPYFFNGVLDQGYWSDGLYTPASPEAFAADILAMKSLGFNLLRKHIKVEPQQFYYDCDRLGMLVLQDMVNCGDYSYLRDTVLPTVSLGFQRLPDRFLPRSGEAKQQFELAMEGTVRLLGSHPSVCGWTIFNEGWGQFDTDRLYRSLKRLDPTRFIDAASGWFRQKESDVESLHIYFRKLALGKTGLPQFLSEFGGWSYRIPDHSFQGKKEYGYRKYRSREELVRDLRQLYGETLPPLVRQGLCGAVYTQLSDVEDETNGFLTFDRRVQKVKPEELADLAAALQRTLEEEP